MISPGTSRRNSATLRGYENRCPVFVFVTRISRSAGVRFAPAITMSCALGVTVTRPDNAGRQMLASFDASPSTTTPHGVTPDSSGPRNGVENIINCWYCARYAASFTPAQGSGFGNFPYARPTGRSDLSRPYVRAASTPGHGGDEVRMRDPTRRAVSATVKYCWPAMVSIPPSTHRSSGVSPPCAGSDRSM